MSKRLWLMAKQRNQHCSTWMLNHFTNTGWVLLPLENESLIPLPWRIFMVFANGAQLKYQKNSVSRLHVSALLEDKSFIPVGVRSGTKPRRLLTTFASVLFYFTDGFVGLTPENPLLPSLLTCSRLPLWGVLAENSASQVAVTPSSGTNYWLVLVTFSISAVFITSETIFSIKTPQYNYF